jgi:hypothetical protein
VAEGARLESVCGGNSTAGSNPALSANPILTEPGMEPGPCASSSSEPCQARKGAALRGNTTSVAGRLGSMAGSIVSDLHPFRSLFPHLVSPADGESRGYPNTSGNRCRITAAASLAPSSARGGLRLSARSSRTTGIHAPFSKSPKAMARDVRWRSTYFARTGDSGNRGRST